MSHDDYELVTGEVALEPRRTVEIERQAPAPLPARQAVAVAATGLIAGAATALVVTGRTRAVARAGRRAPARRRPAATSLGEIVSTQTFLVDVHLIRRSS